MTSPLRLVLAEDGELLRAGIVALLDGYDDVDVVAVATDYDELIDAVDRADPDVVLTDIRMPPSLTDEGIRAAGRIRETNPDLGVVVLTQYADAEYALDLVASGSQGRGYLLKERVANADDLVAALREVAGGGSVIDETVVGGLVSAGSRRPDSALSRLTPRELDVLTLVARGMSNPAIAAALSVTDRAVEKHINSIFAKLDLPADSPLHRRVAAALVYLTDVGTAEPPTGSVPGTARW